MKKLYFFFNLSVFILVCIGISHASGSLNTKSALKEGEYVPKTIIIKIKPEARALCSATSVDEPNIKQAFARIGVTEMSKMFSHTITPVLEKNKEGKKYVDLSLIYEIHFSATIPIEKAIQ